MRVSVTDLVGRPGATRRYDRTLDLPAGDDEGALADVLTGPVHVALALESVVEGILVRGDVRSDVTVPCARCLTTVSLRLDADVAELFVDPLRADEEVDPGYELRDETIDLETMLRDALAGDLPLRVLCREACAGLCPACGADRNVTDCGHEQGAEPDPRWAALQALRTRLPH